MSRSLYRHISGTWRNPSMQLAKSQHERQVGWRREESVMRIEKPTRLDRARSLGYKAKQGIIVVRARVRRGGLHRRTIKGGRRPKRKGILSITMAKSIQRIAEERAAKQHPNLQVLNSYWVGADGKNKYYEVILVDPSNPVIQSDTNLSWLANPDQRGRVYRGKTSAGRRGRGLRWKGKGAEGMRPSRAANIRRERRIQYKNI